MKFRTTLRINAGQVTVADADNITEIIRELGYPGAKPARRDGNHVVWDCEFEGATLAEVVRRYEETYEVVRTLDYHGWAEWTANPDDPMEHAQRTAREVLEWERHFEGVELPDDMRDALRLVAGGEAA